MKKKLFLFIKIALFLIVFGFIIRNTNFNLILNSLKEVNYLYLVASICMSPIVIFLWSQRQSMVLELNGIKVDKIKHFLLNYYASFINNFFVGSIGGDSYITLSVDGDKRIVLKSVLLDRLTGLFILFFFSLPGFFYYFFNHLYFNDVIKVNKNLIALTLIVSLLIIALAIIFKKDKLSQYFFDIKSILLNKKLLSLSVLVQVLMIFNLGLVFLSLGWRISLYNLFLFVPLINLVITLPISIKGYGFRELLISVFFSINISQILLFTIVNTFITILHSSIGAIFYLFNNNRNYSNL